MKEMMSGFLLIWPMRVQVAEQYRLANVVPQWGLVYDEVMV